MNRVKIREPRKCDIYTLLTVPFVTSTASVPSKVPPGEGEVKVPEMLKVVMV